MALAPQIKVTDATGEEVCYVQQKMFKFKEAVTVFHDSTKQGKLCEIKADRVIDWSACYHFFDNQGETFGAVRRKGMRSIWKAHYEVLDEDNALISTIQEENPWSKVSDSLLGEIPILGILQATCFTRGFFSVRLKERPACA